MVNNSQSSPGFAGPGVMLLSAAIFGFFGFFFGMTATTASGQFVLFFAILLWTLRIGAVLFTLAAAITFAAPRAGNLIYCVGGLFSAAGLATVGVMDLMDDQRAAALPPLLAFLFAAWNGYGSWTSLREIMARQRSNSAT
jgi:hypothetical protein